MKKYILLLFIVILLVGCNKVEEETNTTNTKEDDVTVVEEKYVDDNPIIVGLYMNGKLVHEYETAIIDEEDIASFDVYFTNEEDVYSSNTKSNFNKYYNNYENIDKYKIGFYVSFETIDEKKEVVLLDPSKMYDLYYIFTYLYDDVHQADGAWYSHVEVSDVTDDTIYSSIKLYAGGKTDKITSPITLTVFTYDDMDDFDEEGHYRGNSSYTVLIKRK